MKPKVALTYCYGNIAPDFLNSLALLLYQQGHDGFISDIIPTAGLYLHLNRNAQASGFLKTKADWLLSIDTDIQFTPGDVEVLLKSADSYKAPIVSGLYFYRGAHGGFTFCWFEKSEKNGWYRSMPKVEPGMNRIAAAGMGFMLVHRRVLEQMGDEGWFDPVIDPERPNKALIHGEDIAFCYRADQLGFPIYGNADVCVGHVKSRVENLDTFKEQQAIMQLKAATGLPSDELDLAVTIRKNGHSLRLINGDFQHEGTKVFPPDEAKA